MKKSDFETWLTKLGKAWSKRDPKKAASLFSKDCKYYESALGEPCKNWGDILKLWLVVRKNQNGVTFNFEVICFADNTCLANWKVKRILIPSKEKQLIDGIFQFSLNEQGLCNYFKQWRTVKKL